MLHLLHNWEGGSDHLYRRFNAGLFEASLWPLQRSDSALTVAG
jgi:hypothetical protein